MGAGLAFTITFGVESSEIETWKTKFRSKGFTTNGIKVIENFFPPHSSREFQAGVMLERNINPGFETEQFEAPELSSNPHYSALKDEVEAKLMPLFVKKH